MKRCTAGIDIGGTNTLVGIVDKAGNCFAQSSFSTAEYDDPKEFVKRLHREIETLQGESRGSITIDGIGIGAPNGNYYRGSIEFAPNLRWHGVVHLVDLMKQYYSIPVVLTNDANAAAMGEMIYGGAQGMRDFVVITLGTGLGSGIVVNGELVYGHDGFAGEIGHTIVDPNGRQCGCGRKGCLETYASASGIKRTVFELLSETTTPSLLRSVSYADLTAMMITDAAAQGDALALEAFDMTGRILGLKLADAVAHTSPEAIFLFGGLAQAGEFIFEPTRRYMEVNLLNIFKNKVKLLPSVLTEHAAILGASALVRKELST
ncbi:MAG: ROK family protein [Bacteroidetes bacterium]|nr:ROK family protein [Bacteroidota bacterium]MCW5895341.1 ROK family protein [Bacteroidota bacterium]